MKAGPLAGVAIAVKDLLEWQGRPPTSGLPFPPRRACGRDASVLSTLSDAGAQIVGFTKMTELAYEPSGANAQCGRPLNPWDHAYICGGSSSGSAVAVAAGCVPLALGSDTAGSLRIPAHCCGLTAWKPTHGLLPLDGAMPLAPSLDTIGFLARSAADIAPVAALFSHPSGNRARRVAVAGDLAAQSAADIQSAVRAMADVLDAIGLPLGAIDLEPLRAAADQPLMTVLQGEAARANAELIAGGLVHADLALRLAKGASITDGELDAARQTLHAMAATEIGRIFADCDAILLPVMPILTPLVGTCEPSSPTFSARTLYALSRFTRFVNALGLPAVALPAGFDGHGMPIGLQLVGAPGSDHVLLALASAIQDASDWHRHVPPC